MSCEVHLGLSWWPLLTLRRRRISMLTSPTGKHWHTTAFGRSKVTACIHSLVRAAWNLCHKSKCVILRDLLLIVTSGRHSGSGESSYRPEDVIWLEDVM